MTKTILLVDDQEEILEILQLYIEASFDNVETISAISGNSGCEILSTEKIDSIICDYRMPDGNGDVVFKYNLDNEKIPFVWHSATFDIDVENNDKLNGMNTIQLVKPVSQEELVQKLRPILSLVKSEDEFKRIRISTVRKNTLNPYNIYIRINDKKPILIKKYNDALDLRQLENYEQKGVEFLYVKNEDFQKISKDMYQELLAQIENAKTNEQIYFVSSNVVSSVQQELLEIGITNDQVEIAQKLANTCIQNLSREEQLKKLLRDKISVDNYISAHSLLTIQMATIFTSDENILNELGMIAILHDLALTNNRLAQVHSHAKSEDFKKLQPTEKEMVLEHGMRMGKIIKDYGLPENVCKIIENHHKYLNEIGWHNNASELEVIFYLSHEFAHLCCIETVGQAMKWLEKQVLSFNKTIHRELISNSFKKLKGEISE